MATKASERGLSYNETVGLRSVFLIALDRVANIDQRPDRAADIERLWEKVRFAVLCENDTNGDGDCHLCARRRNCELKKGLHDD